MVDRVGAWTNSGHVYDCIEFIALPKRLDKSKIASKYRSSNLSSAQIGECFGISKQAVLARLRSEGVFKAKGRGRSNENYRFRNSTPFGKKVRDGKLVVNPVEVKIARLVVELRDRQGLTWEKICNEVNCRGYLTRRVTKWQAHNVRHVYKLWNGKL
jgi:hypothetical protein